MKTFHNSNIKTRNYDCTNVVCCQAESIELAAAVIPGADWKECSEDKIDSLKVHQLWIQGGVKLFGWM